MSVHKETDEKDSVLNNLTVFITIFVFWIGLFTIVQRLFASRSAHPHRRRRDIQRTQENNVHAAPDILLPVILSAGGLYLMFTLLPFIAAEHGRIPNNRLIWLTGFSILVTLSYFYFLRNKKGPQ